MIGIAVGWLMQDVTLAFAIIAGSGFLVALVTTLAVDGD